MVYKKPKIVPALKKELENIEHAAVLELGKRYGLVTADIEEIRAALLNAASAGARFGVYVEED